MDDATFQARLEEASRTIDSLPENQRGPLIKLLNETRQRHFQLKASLASMRNGLADWRLAVQYLVFDLEATRRELQALRRQQGR